MGKVRKYSIRMIRLVKLVFIIGLMVPCVGDVIGIELKERVQSAGDCRYPCDHRVL